MPSARVSRSSRSYPGRTARGSTSRTCAACSFCNHCSNSPSACAGCGETPYLKLLSQLFGDRLQVANATGCSSIYGGNLPTTPGLRVVTAAARHGRTPCSKITASSGSGYRMAIDKQTEIACGHRAEVGATARRRSGAGAARGTAGHRVRFPRAARPCGGAQGETGSRWRRRRQEPAWRLPIFSFRRSAWIVGGDGWAYDIGYGGLDHVLASGRNVNVLVLDTEVYSNTGGQASKARLWARPPSSPRRAERYRAKTLP